MTSNQTNVSTIKAHTGGFVPPRPGRYIDPNAPLETQIRQLQAFISQPPADSRRLKITPELAEWVLTHLNTTNRPRRSNDIRRYSADMKAGNWRLTGDTIKFNDVGLLADGQHRLTACVRSQTTFESYVVFGIPRDAFHVMDVGRKRINQDAFAVAGIANFAVAAPATRWVRILSSNDPKGRSSSFTNREMLEYYQTLDDKLLDKCVSWAITACKGPEKRGMHSASFAALLYLFMKIDEPAALRLLKEIGAVSGQGKKLIAKLDELNKQTMGRVHDNQRNALTVITFNKLRLGKAIFRDDLEWNDAMPFPPIGG